MGKKIILRNNNLNKSNFLILELVNEYRKNIIPKICIININELSKFIKNVLYLKLNKEIKIPVIQLNQYLFCDYYFLI